MQCTSWCLTSLAYLAYAPSIAYILTDKVLVNVKNCRQEKLNLEEVNKYSVTAFCYWFVFWMDSSRCDGRENISSYIQVAVLICEGQQGALKSHQLLNDFSATAEAWGGKANFSLECRVLARMCGPAFWVSPGTVNFFRLLLMTWPAYITTVAWTKT